MKYPKFSILQLFTFIIAGYLFIFSASYLWRNFFVTFTKSQCKQQTFWQREEELDAQRSISIRWNIEDDSIFMSVTGKTKGWLSIGFSSSNDMSAADIVIGWIKDGKPYLQDRYSVDNILQFLDDKQDYDLIEGEESNEFMSFCFRRKLDTCDRQDYKIKKEFVNVIWATNDEDPPIDNPVYHNSSRGSKRIFLLSSKPKSSSKTKYIDFKSTGETLRNESQEYYSCLYFQIQKNHRQKHLVGVAPLIPITNTKAVRYINVFQCNIHQIPVLETTDCFNPLGTQFLKSCFKLLIRWTNGSDKLFLPSHVGISFPKSSVYLMQIYYNFTDTYGVKRDDSGIRLFLSDSLRPMESDVLQISYSSSFYLALPPHQKEFVILGFCDPKCTKEMFLPNGVKIFGFSFFAKEISTKMKLRQFREDSELEPIIDDHFNTYLQDVIFLKDEIQYLPEDRLVLECTYTTLYRNSTTLGIFSPKSEACQVFLYYYPAVPLSVCQSRINVDNFGSLDQFQDVIRIVQESSDYPTLMRELNEFANDLKWQDNNVQIFQNAQNNQLSICSSSNDQNLQDFNKMSLPTVPPYNDNVNCKANTNDDLTNL